MDSLEEVTLLELARMVEAPGWFDEAEYAFWRLRKVEICFDYLLLVEIGGNGAWVEKELAGWGITVYAKLVWVVEDTVVAGILVDWKHERRVTQWLAKLGVLV
jgi:hypothetical protein